MCVNDLVVQGAEPLFFLDYFATGKLDVAPGARRSIAGIAEGCTQAGCALVGGETAEMPGMYAEGDYDLAGFAVGAAERGALLPRGVGAGRHGARPGQFRRAFQRLFAGAPGGRGERPALDDAGAVRPRRRRSGEALLAPTRIYVQALLALHRAGLLKAAAHITGGGLPGNLPRVLPDGTVARARRRPGRCRRCSRWLAAHRRRRGRGDAARVQLRHRHGLVVRRRRGRDGAAARRGRERSCRIGRIEAGSGAAGRCGSTLPAGWPR